MTITPEIRRERMAELRRDGVYMPPLSAEDLAKDFPPTQFLREHLQLAYLYDRPGGRRHEEEHTYLLKLTQEAWDKSKPHVDWVRERKAELAAKAKAEEQAKADADKAKREQEAAEVKAKLRDRYLSMPGTNADQFEDMYPTILEDHQRREMAERSTAEDRAREAMRSSLRHAIG